MTMKRFLFVGTSAIRVKFVLVLEGANGGTINY